MNYPYFRINDDNDDHNNYYHNSLYPHNVSYKKPKKDPSDPLSKIHTKIVP